MYESNPHGVADEHCKPSPNILLGPPSSTSSTCSSMTTATATTAMFVKQLCTQCQSSQSKVCNILVQYSITNKHFKPTSDSSLGLPYHRSLTCSRTGTHPFERWLCVRCRGSQSNVCTSPIRMALLTSTASRVPTFYWALHSPPHQPAQGRRLLLRCPCSSCARGVKVLGATYVRVQSTWRLL